MLIDFQNYFSFGFSNEFAIKCFRFSPPHHNYVATLLCEMKKIKSGENLVYSTQYHQRTCNFHQTNTLKRTIVESAVKLNTKKVILLHEHTLRDVYSTRRL